MNIICFLDQHSRSNPASPAVVGDEDTVTYAELSRLTSRFAGFLGMRGIRRGDSVGVVLGNGLPFVVGYLGCLRFGAVPVPLNVRLRPEDAAALLDDVGAVAVLGPADFGPEFRSVGQAIDADSLLDDLATLGLDDHVPPVPAQWQDVANIMFTSGSTARAKGVLQTHGMHISTGAALADFYQLSSRDRTALVSPLFHIAGLTFLMTALYLGGPFTLVPSAKPASVLRALEQNQVTYAHFVGTVLSDLIAAAQAEPTRDRLGSLRHVVSGGAAIGPAKLRWFEDRFGCRITSSYGRTEGGKTWCEPDSEQRWNAHGLLNRNVCEFRITDADTGLEVPAGKPGEIQVRGDGVSSGYWNNPELNAHVFRDGGWMSTGDQGFVDHNGYLHFQGRTDGLIKTGGENVSPQAVERALAQVEGIDEVAVVGVPHSRLGETVGALVVSRAGLSGERIMEAARKHLAGFQLPRVIRGVDALPRLGSNKINIPAVKALLIEHANLGLHEQTEKK